MHYDFPKNSFAFTDGQGSGFSLGNDHMKVDAVKASVGFLFNRSREQRPERSIPTPKAQ
jgi:hypothetical protein